MTLFPKIRKTAIWLGIVLPAFMLLVAIWVNRLTSGQFNASFDSVTHTYNILNLLEQTQAHIADAEAGRRGFLLTGREDYVRLRDASLIAVNNDFEQLNKMLGDSKELTQLQTLVSNRLTLDKIDKAKPAANFSAMVLTSQGIDLMNQARDLLFQLRAQQTDVLKKNQAAVEKRILLEETVAVVLVAITAITLIAGFVTVMRYERLHRIVTLCAWTGQIKDGDQWVRMEDFLKDRFDIFVSHGISRAAANKAIEEARREMRAGK